MNEKPRQKPGPKKGYKFPPRVSPENMKAIGKYIRLTPDLNEKVKAVAKKRGVKDCVIMQEAIENYLQVVFRNAQN